MKFKSHYTGASGRQSAFDIIFSPLRNNCDLVIFCHGYKGYKDWGPWDLVAQQFALSGFDFLKFNFSHNGGTVNNPIDFPDTEAFAQNTYSKELEDIECILKRVERGSELNEEKKKYKRIYLIGHSRGGGMAILAAAKFANAIDSLVTWAAVSDFSARFNFDMEKWKEAGVTHIKNGRTGQMLPHNYSFYSDFIANRHDLDIISAARKIKIPWLIAHGQDDEAVCLSNADHLKSLNPNANLLIIKKTGHTFGGAHPWKDDSLPPKLK
ncbi:MAG TPA: alpha/beta fold hydrolase, partial [Cryomorphaceae bacterium]|nr:alpha/beta fold hydrolase [Cryomorphaceae bacterium]